MPKPITLSFPVKNASELASTLGVSKTRQNRIFTIVEKNARKSNSSHVIWASKLKAKPNKSVIFTSRPRRRSNAKAAR